MLHFILILLAQHFFIIDYVNVTNSMVAQSFIVFRKRNPAALKFVEFKWSVILPLKVILEESLYILIAI